MKQPRQILKKQNCLAPAPFSLRMLVTEFINTVYDTNRKVKPLVCSISTLSRMLLLLLKYSILPNRLVLNVSGFA